MDANILGSLLKLVPPVYLGLLILATYLAIVRLRQYYRLSDFKGPATTGISWWWHSKAVLSGQAQRFYGDVTEKYGTSDNFGTKATILIAPGPIARVSPEHLITSDPGLWAHINGIRSPYRRAPWYYHAARFEPGKDNVFTECDNERHDARRKKMYAGVCTFWMSASLMCQLMIAVLWKREPDFGTVYRQPCARACSACPNIC